MIPISDENIRQLRFPYVVVGIIVVNVVVFLYQLTLSDASLSRFIQSYGVVPVEITIGRDLNPTIPLPIWFTLFSSMFMHGGFMHIIGNMLYLWVFGDNIEDVLGHGPFLVFYAVCGLAAAGAQILTDPMSPIPGIGASGAVAGVLGAYLVLYPRHNVNCLVFFFYFIRIIRLPALVVLGFWIVLQLFNGLLSFGVTTGVAYWAHIGGFVVGMVLFLPLFLVRRSRGRRSIPYDDRPGPWR